MKLKSDHNDAFSRATIRQARGSALRLIQFQGGELTYDRQDELVLSMGLTANHTLDYETGRFRAAVIPLIGRFGLMTPGQKYRITLRGDCRVLQLVLPRTTLENWLTEDHEVDDARLEIAWGHTLDDPTISHLLCAAQVAGPEHEAPLLREMVTRLFERFSPQAARVTYARGGLPARKVRRVIEMIEDDPAQFLSIEEMAAAVAISPFHFARQFRAATGRSPHRFMIERRVSRAVEMLAASRLPIADIAAGCGFAHASHLSRHMQRLLGQSPAELRRVIAI